MVRISTNLLPASSSGVPQTEITNPSIAITSNSTLSTSDTTAQQSLQTIATNTGALSSTLNVSDSTAQQTLQTIATNTGALSSTVNVSDSSAQQSLQSINTSLLGTLNVSDFNAQSSLATTSNTLAGTLQVSSSSTINGSAGNLFNAQTVSSGTQSSIVSVSAYTKNTIYVSATTSNEIRVYGRGASGAGFQYIQSLYPWDPSYQGNSNEATLILNDYVIDSIRLEATGNDTITASVFSRA